MRVVILDTYYAAFVADHYRRHPALANAPYLEQHAALMSRAFGVSDAYSHFLGVLGHEAVELIGDCEPLQYRWATEQERFVAERQLVGRIPGPAGHRARRWLLQRIAMAQIQAFDPDVVYCQNLEFLSRRQLDELRARGALVVGQIASPAPGDRQLRGYDLILSSFPHFVSRFRALGVDSEEFRLAFDPRILDRLRERGVDPAPSARRESDIVFVGGVDPGVHRAGTELLERLCANHRVDVWGYGAGALAPDSAIARSYRGEAWGLEMYGVLASAKVALNRHIDVAGGYANNMRLYEATGMGAALVTDAGTNLAELFEPGHEVAVYRDVGELAAAIDRLLANEDERLKIATAGQQRTLTEHTFAQRMEELASIIEQHLNTRTR
jgi:glycosyltransferase involved in cell wall biosynthesis